MIDSKNAIPSNKWLKIWSTFYST